MYGRSWINAVAFANYEEMVLADAAKPRSGATKKIADVCYKTAVVIMGAATFIMTVVL